MIPKKYSEAINRRQTDNTITYRTLHIKLKIQERESNKKPGVNLGINEVADFGSPALARFASFDC